MRPMVGQSGDGTAVYGVVGSQALNLTARDPALGADLGAINESFTSGRPARTSMAQVRSGPSL